MDSYNGNMIVAKFGGSSLADAEGFARVARLIRENDIPIVIVSAPGRIKASSDCSVRSTPQSDKVTDLLIAAYNEWERSGDCENSFEKVQERLQNIALSLDMDISRQLDAIKTAIDSGAGYDYAVSRGEVVSARILSSLLGYDFLDAKECIKLKLNGEIDFKSILAHSEAIKPPCVIPGFYGKLPNGKIKLLPRGGSDISGAAIAAAVNGEYQKWTDVGGGYDGHGGVITRLNYDEAELLCYFGATVMQYEAIPILKKANVSLTVKNSFSHSEGTLISKERCEGYAFSSRTMLLGGNEAYAHIDEILSEGLKIPFRASLLGEKKVIIDDCGFSPLALKRILPYSDIRTAKVTAVIGKIPFEFANARHIYSGENGSIFVE